MWGAFTRRSATYQTRILLTLVYLVVVGPSVLAGRILRVRLLDAGSPDGRRRWHRRDQRGATSDLLERQF